MARTEEDILAGVLRIRVGGVEKTMPTLKLKAAREWKAQLIGVMSSRLDGFNVTGTADFAQLAQLAGDQMLDLVLAYDKTGALGGREWLEDNADDAQLYAVLRQALEVSFPFVTDLAAVAGMLRSVMAGTALAQPAPSAGGKSTNGRSPTGGLIPTPSESA